jgi:hypothetical protein
MPRQNAQANLIDVLDGYETRLRKAERQLSVSRTAYSVIATKESTGASIGSPAVLTTPDRLTIVTTDNCLVDFFVQVTLENSAGASAGGYVYIYDETGSTITPAVAVHSSASAKSYVSVPGTDGADPSLVLGGRLTVRVTTAGPRTYSLRYGVTSGTVSASNRRLYATVEPF